jgi:predicted phage terminase large subunit-like protein
MTAAAIFGSVAERYERRADPARHRRWTTLGELARAVEPTTVETPALELISQAVVETWAERDGRLIISVPPQEGKSERVTKIGSLWALADNPQRRLAIASYGETLAEGFGRDIRNWITMNDGTDDTLDLGLRIARDNGAARRWKLANRRGGVICVGVGSGFTGRPADGLVVDDPFADASQAESEYYRDRVWRWWQAVAGPRLAPGSPVIVILTRWHEDDFAGRLKAAEDGHRWRVINIPALADHDPAKGQTDPLGRAPGEWLESSRRRTRAQWEAIRIERGTRVFTSLYQGRPSPAVGNVWRRPWWRRYPAALWTIDGAGRYTIHGADEVLQSWDLAFKDTKGSDYVVGQVWARFGAQAFLVDQVHRRMSFTETLAAFEHMVAKWPQASAKLVEDKANGPAVISMLSKRIAGITPITPVDSKYARATAVAPFVEAGNVHLPAPEVQLFDVDELVDEAAAFPNSQHDDQVDATSQALRRLFLDGAGHADWVAFLHRRAEQLAADPVDEDLEAAAPALTIVAGPIDFPFRASRGGRR